MAQTGLALAASSWGVLMGIAPILQIRRMLRERSARDVSLGYFAVLLIGFLLWITYGLAARNLALVIPNSPRAHRRDSAHARGTPPPPSAGESDTVIAPDAAVMPGVSGQTHAFSPAGQRSAAGLLPYPVRPGCLLPARGTYGNVTYVTVTWRLHADT